jgi:hypothetical protein
MKRLFLRRVGFSVERGGIAKKRLGSKANGVVLCQKPFPQKNIDMTRIVPVSSSPLAYFFYAHSLALSVNELFLQSFLCDNL